MGYLEDSWRLLEDMLSFMFQLVDWTDWEVLHYMWIYSRSEKSYKDAKWQCQREGKLIPFPEIKLIRGIYLVWRVTYAHMSHFANQDSFEKATSFEEITKNL